MIQSDQAKDHQEAPVGADATSCCAETIVDLPGFVVLAAGEYGGELELLVETTATEVDCSQCGTGAVVHDRREHLLRDVPRLQPVDLVQRDHDRDAETEHLRRHETVAGANSLARIEHEQDALDVLEGRVDGALHVLGQRVAGPLEAGQVGEHELELGAVRDAEDPPPRRLRLVRDDRDLAAAEGVHERRLPDVRTSSDGDEPASQPGRFHVSGRSSAGVYSAMGRPACTAASMATPRA